MVLPPADATVIIIDDVFAAPDIREELGAGLSVLAVLILAVAISFFMFLTVVVKELKKKYVGRICMAISCILAGKRFRKGKARIFTIKTEVCLEHLNTSIWCA